METNHTAQYQLFLDLDGVLADFDRGVKELTGSWRSDLAPKAMWPRLARTPNFYDTLEWMIDGQTLWQACRGAKPVILTGLPLGKWAEPQKRSWCERQLGSDVPVITCLTRHKPLKAHEWLEQNAPGDHVVAVLVDDRDKIKQAWEEAGGIFVHHKKSEESLAQLRDLGVIGS